MKKLASLVAVLSLCSFTAVAQTGSLIITGQVTTRDDNGALPGATVSIPDLGLSTTTDSDGRYRLEVPAEQVRNQNVDLIVEFQGLQTRTAQLRVNPGTLSRDFGLAVAFGQVITVGSRVIGAAEEKAVPVDILTEEQLETTGRVETTQIIQALAPSINFPRTTITDGTDTVRPATLRGLGPDQMLVLINGKRRHSTAIVHVNNSIGRGSSGVDLNAIPASAIENVEILREGAAAQYGSDAIAGVINMVLKSGAVAPTVALKGGATTHGDGEMLHVEANGGMTLGRGSLFGTIELRDRGETNRARPDPRPQVNPNDAGNNAVPQPNHHWGDSEQSDILGFVNFTLPLRDDERTFFYAFGGVGHREGSHGGFYRRGLDARNWPQIYPLGFLPLIEPVVTDVSATTGARGDIGGWFWDVSTQYGMNDFEFNVSDSLNTSLGPNMPPNQTEFYAGTVTFGQWVTNFDMSRGVNVGLAGPLNVAFGVEYRQDNYQIEAGEPASYINGGHLDRNGAPAAPGAQVFPGYQPANEVDVDRSNYGLYVDLEGDITRMLRVGVATRFEDYNDFGSTSDYKLTLRLAPIERLVLRGSVATGFRAPSLVQSFYSATTTNFLSVNGVLTPFEVRTVPVGGELAQLLGAEPLTPEDSSHLSFGVVWEPLTNLEITADFYNIDIEDRIVLSGNFTGSRVDPILRPFGVSGARFFTNAIDTETDGFDVVVNHRRAFLAGNLALSGAYSHNETEIVRVAPTPPQLSGLEQVLFDRIETRRVECGQPKDNIRLMQQWSRGGFTGTLHENQYGEFCSFTSLVNGTDIDDQIYRAKWILDLDLAYRWGAYTFGVGAQNLLDEFPDENKLNSQQSNFNIFTYPSHSPFGMNGAFIYSRIGYTF